MTYKLQGVYTLHGTFVGHRTWVRAVPDKAHGRVGGMKQRQGGALDGFWQHTMEPCAT